VGLMPKRVKHRKTQRGKVKGSATRGNFVAFGDFGLMALQPGWVTSNQIEAARIVLSRACSGQGRYWIRSFPQKPITKTAAETRMGGGKGAVDYWAAVVKPGTILFEVAGLPETIARELFRKQAGKLPIKVKFVRRRPVL
jgi:large subunit ribosomal protein L16